VAAEALKTPHRHVRRDKHLVACVALVAATHVVLSAWIALRTSPNINEPAHLYAGLVAWQTGRFDAYSVNPPLTRMVAALPGVLSRPDSIRLETEDSGPRAEFRQGRRFFMNHKQFALSRLTWGRWACLPLSLLGGYICFQWARELHGTAAGLIAMTLWAFSPNLLAWDATICPDAHAASIGITANYCFWKWLRDPSWGWTLTAGVAFGLALLTKMTWILLFGLWPLIWLIWLTDEATRQHWKRRLCQLAATMLFGLFVLNLGYGFEGTFTQLGEFTFESRTLAGDDSLVTGGTGGNRFARSRLGRLPVPLPYHYVRGIDIQKVDFEEGMNSYLLGVWQDHGWWYYYAVCAGLKVPLGTWALAVLALSVRVASVGNGASCADSKVDPQERSHREMCWRDEVALLVPPVVLAVFVSSQTGFSCHFRYVLPALPFVFVWVSGVAPVAVRRPASVGILATYALLWTATSSLWIFPHCMSYFNELAGGPRTGHRYLLDSNLDWGQDVSYLAEWVDEHPNATPLHVLARDYYQPELFDIANEGLPRPGPKATNSGHVSRSVAPSEMGPLPGWFALSIHRIREPSCGCEYFLRFEPVAMAGYSIHIYHITPQDANRVREQLGLPEVGTSTHDGLTSQCPVPDE
jgi:dolichyl-phosphate-mannose-protein mannosyltransferase